MYENPGVLAPLPLAADAHIWHFWKLPGISRVAGLIVKIFFFQKHTFFIQKTLFSLQMRQSNLFFPRKNRKRLSLVIPVLII